MQDQINEENNGKASWEILGGWRQSLKNLFCGGSMDIFCNYTQ